MLCKWITITAVLFFSSLAQARVTRIEITKIQSPTFENQSFGAVGTYDRISGWFYGELEPSDPKLRDIADIQLAEKASNGKIQYKADFFILRPTSLELGNDTIVYDFNNRGRKNILLFLNDAPPTNEPVAKADAGNGFLMQQGFTLVWSGFLGDVPPGDSRLTIQLPIAKNLDGSRIEGKVLSECFNDFWTDATDMPTCPLAYKVPSLDKSQLRLTVRERRGDPPIEITDWEFASDRSLKLASGNFQAGKIYLATHRGADPIVMGLGYPAVQDWMNFLKTQTEDDFGNANPLANHAKMALSFGLSQAGKASRDFVYLGFNGAAGKKAFEGMIILGASSRPFLNFRFAQPTRVSDLIHEGLYYPNTEFPYAFQDEKDPLTGRVDGILHRCTETSTCPSIFYGAGSVDYWAGRNSLVTTDPLGSQDAALPNSMRVHLFTGLGHAARPTGFQGSCQNDGLDLRYNPFLRKFLIDLKLWIEDGTAPPPSQYPKISDGTLVENASYVWPTIPNQAHPSPLLNAVRLFDWVNYVLAPLGKFFPDELPSPYKALVPQVDVDGNEMAGLKLPAISVPLATYTGWNRRARNFAIGEACGLMGSEIPFASSSSIEGDSRKSISERYGSQAEYQRLVELAADQLISNGHILASDRNDVITQASQKWH